MTKGMNMSKTIWISLSLLATAWISPLQAEELGRLALNIGGGISAPQGQTGKYAGLSGNFSAGAGYNINKRSSIIGEFFWSGLPPSISVLHPINAPVGHINLYNMTVNYRYQIDRIRDSVFGVYFIGGGGWYYRYSQVDKNYVVPPLTVCQPIYTWWGYGCDPGGYVYTQTVAFKGTSAGGVNAGTGFTIRFGDSNWKFYIESRYHYAWHNNIPTALLPVTLGIRLN